MRLEGDERQMKGLQELVYGSSEVNMACPRSSGRWGGGKVIEETQSKETFKHV